MLGLSSKVPWAVIKAGLTKDNGWLASGTLAVPLRQHTPYAWRYTDTEADPKNDEAIDLFAEEIRALLIKVRDAPKRAVRVGHLVVSPHQEFGQYPTRLLGDPGDWVPSSK